ncbi:hypothetical protein BACI348_30082 [Bacillus altitudinis]|uniref:Uncharacterized protein n=1 Tax=Bacillus altitudinis TaxID=293387 RepID=A0A653MG34_BACAB|nr:hypothetical protein BACI348_30082 [Bacillus altitudinis]
MDFINIGTSPFLKKLSSNFLTANLLYNLEHSIACILLGCY